MATMMVLTDISTAPTMVGVAIGPTVMGRRSGAAGRRRLVVSVRAVGRCHALLRSGGGLDDRRFPATGTIHRVPCTVTTMIIDLSAFDAFLFDLDGGITRTAELHASAWKTLFDEYLAARAARRSARFAPFDIAIDYRAHVDGKPRRAGVRDFLASRDVRLPEGTPHDEPTAETVHGLGKRKDRYFRDLLEREGVAVYQSAIALVREARAQGVKTAVVSSSRNTARVLRVARLTDLFQVRVDGAEASRVGLAGKPDPAMFLEAARRLGVLPARSVVFEDATAGVEAGRRGGFGPRGGGGRCRPRRGPATAWRPRRRRRSRHHTAHVAGPGRLVTGWSLVYEGFDPAQEPLRETLCTLGNGYFATRGAAAESAADSVHYPGTYIAGCYDRLPSVIEGRALEHEDLVNAPNWLPTTFRRPGEPWFSLPDVQVLSYRQELDLRRGILLRDLQVRDRAGRTTRVESRRLVSMASPHLAALETIVTPVDWSGPLEIRAALDGRVVNDLVARYRQLAKDHLVPMIMTPAGRDGLFLKMRTHQSEVVIAQAARP
jgi:beta-phosphoglucomutase family hydrolase